MSNQVIIIGDSTHNTLSAVRSFGEAGIVQTLLLVCQEDTCYVRYSKYLHKAGCRLYIVSELDDCLPILEQLSATQGQTLMTTYDAAAEWVDVREEELSRWFRTPCRGRQLGPLFNKAAQCELARACGLDVPVSLVYHRGEALPDDQLVYPVITKPLVSSDGEKSDIHICRDRQELDVALATNSHCPSFIIQQFIEKEFELNALGASTDKGVVMGGAIRKFRHWPHLVGACTFGLFDKIDTYQVNTKGVALFLERSGYHGPFSVEFLHTKDGKNYFMEVNFRNEGLAYASTCAGANLHALYVDASRRIDWKKFRRTYMMNYSIDLLYVKEGDLTWGQWLRDFVRTRCFINICFHDPGPVWNYYKHKMRK